jgi:uncharacterized protein YbaP (TraB family)
MRRTLLAFVVSLLCFALPALGADRGALFKISGNGHTMHLFGTMHVGLPEFYPLEPRIAAAVAGASTLALEIDPLHDPAGMAKAMQAHALLAPGSATWQDLPQPFRQRLERALTRARIEPAAVLRFKPWLVATTLALAEYAHQGYRAELSVDMRLAQLARDGKVPVIELESVAGQLSMFDRLGMVDQWRFLEESIDLIESGKQRAEVRQIVEAWRTADRQSLDAIAARAEADTTLSGQFVQKVMLEERNGPLAEKLAALLEKQDNSVAAIGVLHLVGKHSVPEKLRARGLTVERIY